MVAWPRMCAGRKNEQIRRAFSPGVGRPLYGLVEPRLLRALNEVKVLSAAGSEPGQYGYALGKSSTGSVGVIYGPVDAATDDRIKVIFGRPVFCCSTARAAKARPRRAVRGFR